MDDIRYHPGKDNRVLRLALLQAWGYACYWCRRPQDFADVEIDHIIPQKTGQHVVDDDLLSQYLTPPDQAVEFDVHAAQNLAPICGDCNNEKTNALFAGAPRFMTVLGRARVLQPRVEKSVRAFHRSDQVTKALLAISVADMTDPAATKALKMLGPVLVNRLRSVAPEALTEPSNYGYSDPYADQLQQVVMTLDEQSRRARVILEDVYRCHFDDAIKAIVEALDAGIERHLMDDITTQFENRGHNYPVIDDADGRREIVITALRFDPEASDFVAHGTFEADGSTLVGVDSINDSGIAWTQGDADTEGTFTVHLWADEDEESAAMKVVVDDPMIEYRAPETSLNRLARLYEEDLPDDPDHR